MLLKNFPRLENKLNFIDFAPTGVLCTLSNSPCTVFNDDAPMSRSVSLLNNSTSIVRILSTIVKKYNKLRRMHPFLHEFYRDGLEDSQLYTSLNELNDIIDIYDEISSSISIFNYTGVE